MNIYKYMNNLTPLVDLYKKIEDLPKIHYINNDVLTIIFSFLPWQEFSQIKEYYQMYYLSYKTYFKINEIPYLTNICLENKEYKELIKYLVENEQNDYDIDDNYIINVDGQYITKNITNYETEIILSMYFCIFSGYLDTFIYLNEKYNILNFVNEHDATFFIDSHEYYNSFKKINNYYGKFNPLFAECFVKCEFRNDCLLTILYILKSFKYLEFIKYLSNNCKIKISNTFKFLIYSKMNIKEFEYIFENNIYNFKITDCVEKINIINYLKSHKKKEHLDFLHIK
jgi:hypothetical protein